MCGRYSQAADLAKLAKRFGLKLTYTQDDFLVKPRYNMAPSDKAPTVVLENGEKHLEFMSWGLTRQWGKEKPPVFVINLRAEKLANGPFRAVLRQRRCLVAADGFYEWKTEGKKKLPFRFTLKDDSLFAMPAIYDDVTDVSIPKSTAEMPRRAFSIFTTDANALVEPVHHRMPAILPPELEEAWLDPHLTDVQKIVAMLQPYPVEKMKSWAVSTAINSAKYDSADLLNPI